MNKRLAPILFALLLFCSCAKGEEVEQQEAQPSFALLDTAEPLAAPVFNEAMSRNYTAPIGGLLCDWVELYNDSASPIPLGGLFIGKKRDGGRMSPLPQQTMEPGEYLLLTEKELGFRLDKNGEELFLFDGDGNILQSMTLPALQGSESFTREFGVVDAPTPGCANDGGETGGSFAPSPLIISEASTSSLKDVKSIADDWVEICNTGSEAVSLEGYYLSDDQDELRLLPLKGMLQAGEYRLIRLQEQSAPFQLSASGESVYLSNSSGLVCALLDVPYIPAGCSYGRENGRDLYYSTPTPGTANRDGYESMCVEPEVSVPSGWYEEPFSVTLSGEGEIRYTTDGSLPTAKSRLYAGESIPVEKSMSLRIRCFDGSRIPSGTVTVNYFLDALPLTLDVVKITIDNPSFYTIMNPRSVAKVPASIAFYVDGVEQFSESCGISIIGSGGRTHSKLSYQIDFRSRYGKPELHYKLFDKIEQSEFSTLTLRSGSQDQRYASMRDELISDIFFDCSDSLLTFSYRPVSLYLNEKYWGVYYIRERVKPVTVAYRYDVSEGSVSIVRNISYPSSEGTAGAELDELLQFIRSSDMALQENYEAVCARMNIESLIDFYAALMWSNNYDSNNIRFFRSDADGGRWHLILYDSDVALLRKNDLWVKRVFSLYSGLFSSLMKNEEFKERFTLRLGELLGGPLAEERVINRIDALEAVIDHDKFYDCQVYLTNPDYKEWKREVEALRSRKGAGVLGLNENVIRQYLSCVELPDELIMEAFGDEFVSSAP